MRQPNPKLPVGQAWALLLVGALALMACEAPLPIAPVVDRPSPEASPSLDPLGPPSF